MNLSHQAYVQNVYCWPACLQSLAVVFHSVVNGFLWQGRPNQLKCILKLASCFGIVAACDKTPALPPKPDNPVDW